MKNSRKWNLLAESKNPYVISTNDNNNYYIIFTRINLKIKKKKRWENS